MSLNPRLVATAALFALLVGPVTPASAEVINPVPEERREMILTTPLEDPNRDISKVWLTYGALGGIPITPGPSLLMNISKSKFCDEFEGCLANGDSLISEGFAPYCKQQKQTLCVEKVEFRLLGTKDWTEAIFLNYWDATPSKETLAKFNAHVKTLKEVKRVTSISKTKTWLSDAKSGLVGSAPGALMFDAPGFAGPTGATTYLIEPYFRQHLGPFRSGRPTGKNFGHFQLVAKPIVEVQSEEAHVGVDFVGLSPEGNNLHMGTGIGNNAGAYAIADGRYGFSSAWNPELEMRITILAPSEIGGWFHSRLSGPDLQLSQVRKGVNRLVVSGFSTKVPVTTAAVPALAPESRKYLEYTFGRNSEAIRNLQRAERELTGGMATGSLWDPSNGTKDFEFWFSKFPKKAKGEISVWTVAKMPTERLGNNRCMNRTDRIQGLINTNAMVYQSLVPEFKNGFLDYQVMGVHYNPDGEEFRGEYDLIMRSDAARCLYRLSKAPVSGTVTVVDAKGKTEVSTTTLGESKGWLRLSAKNFTFSKKTIKIKLKQKR